LVSKFLPIARSGCDYIGIVMENATKPPSE